MAAMPLPLKALYHLGEATQYLAKTTGEQVTLSMLLDWAAQDCFGLWLPVERQVVRFHTERATSILNHLLVELAPSAIQAIELARGHFVKFDDGAYDGRPFRFVSDKTGGHGYPEDQAVQITMQQLVIKGAELEAFVHRQSEPERDNGPDIDPADLPEELDIARIAFTAVKNGYGKAHATFKNRLLAYLQEHYPKMSDEARQRIATVANPDKAAGRRKR
jgi:hypothetical protein